MEWIIVPDWNREPEEIGNSMLAKYLRGVVVAPDVPMTCRSTNDAGGRVLDFALASSVLANLTTCTTDLDVPFKPHFLAVNFKLRLDTSRTLDRKFLHLTPSHSVRLLGKQLTHGMDATRTQGMKLVMIELFLCNGSRPSCPGVAMPASVCRGCMRHSAMLLRGLRLCSTPTALMQCVAGPGEQEQKPRLLRFPVPLTTSL